jgi:hypothetical protein
MTMQRYSLDPRTGKPVRDDSGGWVRWDDVARYRGNEAAVTAAYAMGRTDQRRELTGIRMERQQ